MEHIIYKRIKIWGLVLFMITPLLSFAQDEIPASDFQGVTDNIMSPITSTGNYDVNHTSGGVSLGIPLFNVKGDHLSHPVSLSYQSTGFKVDEEASRVGLGWTLNAGGHITRTAKSVPDEAISFTKKQAIPGTGGEGGDPAEVDVFSLGRLFFSEVNDNYQINDDFATSEEQGVKVGFYDNMPDDFFISCPGISGRFVFKDYQTIMTIPHNPDILSIVPSFSDIPMPNPNDIFQNPEAGREIISFVITTNKGLQYTFDVTESSRSSIMSPHMSLSLPSINKWYLSEIKNVATDEVIDFNYTTLTEPITHTFRSRDIDSPDGSGVWCSFNKNNAATAVPSNTIIDAKILTGISATHGTLNLNLTSNTRYDLINDTYYDNLSYNGTVIKLITSYFETPDDNSSTGRRLRLDEIKSEIGGQSLSLHDFDYYDDIAPPTKRSQSTDLWGYFRGEVVNTAKYIPLLRIGHSDNTVIPLRPNFFAGQFLTVFNSNVNHDGNNTFWQGVDRTSNLQATQSCVLKSVENLYGGQTEFEYELNQFQVVGQESLGTFTGGGLRVASKKITSGDKINKTKYTYEESSVDSTSGYIDNFPQFFYTVEPSSLNSDLNSASGVIHHSFHYSSQPINDPREYTISYSKVTEHYDWRNGWTEESGSPYKGKSVFIYTSSKDVNYRDINATTSVDRPSYFLDDDGCVSNSTGLESYFDGNQLWGKSRRGHRRGLLKERHDYSALAPYPIVKSTVNDYDFESIDAIPLSSFKTVRGTYVPEHLRYDPVDNPDGVVARPLYERVVYDFELRSERVLLKESSVTMDGIETVSVNNYIDYAEGEPNTSSPKSTTTYRVGGTHKLQTTYTFPFELPASDATGQLLMSENIYGSPIKSEMYLGSILSSESEVTNGTLIDGAMTTYQLNNGKIVPEEFYTVKQGNFVLASKAVGYHANSGKITNIHQIKSNGISLGVEKVFAYQYGEISSTTYGQLTQQLNYNNLQLPESHIDENGLKTEYLYDELKRIESVTSGIPESSTEGLSTTSYSYDYLQKGDTENSITETTTFIDGTTTQTVRKVLDDWGRVLSVIGIGHLSSGGDAIFENYEYDRFGQVSNKTMLGQGTQSYAYERSPLSRLLTTTFEPVGTSTNEYAHEVYTLDGKTLKLSKTITIDPNKDTTEILSDILDNTIVLRKYNDDGDPVETIHRYDEYNRLVSVTLANQDEYSYVYNNRNLIIRKTEPGNVITEYFYDDLDRLMATKDGNGNIVGINYDNNDRILETGFLSSMPTDPSLYPQTFTQILTVNTYVPNKAVSDYTEALLMTEGNTTDFVRTDYQYDDYFRIESSSINRPDLGGNGLVSYDYDYNAANLIRYTTYTTQYGTFNQSYVYDDGLRPEETWLNGKQVSKLFYNEYDQLRQKSLGKTADSWLQNLNYTYDVAGRLKTINENALTDYSCDELGGLCNYEFLTPLTGTSEFFVRDIETNTQAINLPNYPYSSTDLDLLITDLEDWLSLKGFAFEEISIEAKQTATGQLFEFNIKGSTCDFKSLRVGDGSIYVGFPIQRKDCCMPNNNLQDPKDLFAMNFNYSGTNIENMTWKVMCQNQQRYDFTYSTLNFLKTADYKEINSQNNEEGIGRYSMSATYDNIGNITTLSRNGVTSESQNGAFSYGKIDDLVYTYNSGTNRLDKVQESDPQAFGRRKGFKPFASNFKYDDNGNIDEDSGKGLTIDYNYLNLPKYIQVTPSFNNGNTSGNITITYDAAGTKHRKVVRDGSGNILIQKDYLPQLELENNTLEAAYFEDVRLTPNEATGGYKYEYKINDHLGNTRVSFADLNGDQVISKQEILQQNHYYPFGMNMEGSWDNVHPITAENAYQYNGNELNQDLGINLSDFNARWYDATLGRFISVDPLAEQDIQIDKSAYAFAWNDPILLSDKTGLSPNSNDDDDEYTDIFELKIYGVNSDGKEEYIGSYMVEVGVVCIDHCLQADDESKGSGFSGEGLTIKGDYEVGEYKDGEQEVKINVVITTNEIETTTKDSENSEKNGGGSFGVKGGPIDASVDVGGKKGSATEVVTQRSSEGVLVNAEFSIKIDANRNSVTLPASTQYKADNIGKVLSTASGLKEKYSSIKAEVKFP